MHVILSWLSIESHASIGSLSLGKREREEREKERWERKGGKREREERVGERERRRRERERAVFVKCFQRTFDKHCFLNRDDEKLRGSEDMG